MLFYYLWIKNFDINDLINSNIKSNFTRIIEIIANNDDELFYFC